MLLHSVGLQNRARCAHFFTLSSSGNRQQSKSSVLFILQRQKNRALALAQLSRRLRPALRGRSPCLARASLVRVSLLGLLPARSSSPDAAPARDFRALQALQKYTQGKKLLLISFSCTDRQLLESVACVVTFSGYGLCVSAQTTCLAIICNRARSRSSIDRQKQRSSGAFMEGADHTLTL